MFLWGQVFFFWVNQKKTKNYHLAVSFFLNSDKFAQI
jgi:hypothetical protein